MRMPSVLLLLPVLVLLSACTQTVPSAIAADDRPTSPEPAIASPVPAPLTLKSLAGTYQWQAVINEQWLAELLEAARRMGLDEKELKELEEFTRSAYSKSKITIYADGWCEFQEGNFKGYGKVRLDGNKLFFLQKPTDDTGSSTKVDETAMDVSVDRRNILLYNDPQNPSQLLRRYVKQ
ncbi:hypothetical protein H6F76_07950 [Leptolyngbya sp. FACHB-321]|uniref:hypothetical protein n=1 Tax=Leptolyngbya sp. FACHB-321 TaxID=2692807 RepID=UPI0016895120|nr:hypothetical protein [Leptolyngbya sp. FACHB-321]MBD2034962.1 hypothetical protein [Leptolyngbya sp. FACHB-321]